MKSKLTVTPVEPDGKCHAVAALIEGCAEPVGEGLWSCHHHFAQTYQRGQELIADADERGTRGEPPSRGSSGPASAPVRPARIARTSVSPGAS